MAYYWCSIVIMAISLVVSEIFIARWFISPKAVTQSTTNRAQNRATSHYRYANRQPAASKVTVRIQSAVSRKKTYARGAHFSVLGRWARRKHWVCDARPVRRQIYGCLPLLTPAPIYTAWWQRHMTCVNNTCPGLHPMGVEPATCWSLFQRPNYCATEPAMACLSEILQVADKLPFLCTLMRTRSFITQTYVFVVGLSRSLWEWWS